MLQRLPKDIAWPLSRTARVRRLLYRGEIALSQGDLFTAEERGQSALALLDRTIHHRSSATRPDSQLHLASLGLVARVRRELTDFTMTSRLYRQALAVLEAAPATVENHRRSVPVLIGLGESLRLLGRFSEAELQLRRAVQLAERIQPTDPTLLAATLNGLGIVFKDTGRFRDAAAAYDRARQLCEQSMDPDDALIATILHNLAGLAHAEGRPVEGEAHIRRGLQLRCRLEGPGSTGTASDLAVLGALLLAQHRLTEAEPVLRQSQAIWEDRFGRLHYEVAIVEHNLAVLYAERGDHDRAALAYRRARNIKRHVLGTEHPEVVALEDHLARRYPPLGLGYASPTRSRSELQVIERSGSLTLVPGPSSVEVSGAA
jgi:tetratricopeptide (TPR) repeat protein